MSRFHIIEHPLIAHKMSVLRDKETKTPLFRQTLREVAYLMTFAVTQHLDMVAVRIETPLEVADCHQLKAPNPCLVSILRAGNGLTEALLNILPEASVGHLGMARNDETLKPEKYYTKLPNDISARQVCVQIREHMPHASRLQLIHFLFGIAKADDFVSEKEIDEIRKIAGYLYINQPDFESIEAMFYDEFGSAYKILEIEKTATDDEVKKAYRTLAKKHHPDKLQDLGEEHLKGAQEKFQSIQAAYEKIKKERGF